jgi:serine protease Do
MSLWAFAAVAPAQDEDKAHVKVLDKARPSVVAVRALAVGGERSGTGVFLDDAGLILTSYWVVPEGAENPTVWTTEPRRYAAEVVAHSKLDEIAILRIKPKAPTTPIEWTESAKVRIGDVSYTLGNAENSMINDNQPSLNFGVVSGFYNLRERRSTSYYAGWVFETTAAVNEKMEGAPLLDARGRMIGMVTLNYSPHRWLGNAIPSDGLRGRVDQLLKEAARASDEKEADGAGYLGLAARPAEAGLEVERVETGSPAERAGIRAGDRIVSIRGKKPRTVDDLRNALKDLKAGDLLFVEVDFGGFVKELKVELEAPPRERKP